MIKDLLLLDKNLRSLEKTVLSTRRIIKKIIDPESEHEHPDDLVVNGFLSERCELNCGFTVAFNDVYNVYVKHCNESGYKQLSQKGFSRSVIRIGQGKIDRVRRNGGSRCFLGIDFKK